jgi:TIR domain
MVPPRVFISHASAQRATAVALAEAMEATGVSTWISYRDIKPGEDWVDAIPVGVRSAEVVLVLVSPEAMSSDWVDRELMMAVRSKRKLLPVLLGDTRPSERFDFLFGTVQCIPARERPTKRDLTRIADRTQSFLTADSGSETSISEVEPGQAPEPPDAFEHRVTSARPAYFVILLDQSGSMNLRMPGHKDYPRRRAVAEVVNDMLYKLLQASLKEDGYRHYFDVSVCGYGMGDSHEDVRSLLPGGFEHIAVEHLDQQWLRIEAVTQMQTLPDGSEEPVTISQPVWVEGPPAKGRTVMAKAFRHADGLVQTWIAQNPESLPPVVMNISDGAWTGENPVAAVRELQERATKLGATLVFNCQLGSSEKEMREQLVYPAEVPDGYHRRTQELFWLSSMLPASMREEARARGYDVAQHARGLLFGAPISRLVDFLGVGTRTIT